MNDELQLCLGIAAILTGLGILIYLATMAYLAIKGFRKFEEVSDEFDKD